MINDKDLSKYLSLVLRHQPEKLDLTLTSEGFTSLPELLDKMRAKSRWSGLKRGDIDRVVRQSEKQRFEIVDDQIRARYGHSVAQAMTYPPIEPPEILYHGTSPDASEAIRIEGLMPMNRQYVHHSTETQQALMVGRRHHPRPVILIIRAREAWQEGVIFHQPEDRLFISGPVPAAFIDWPDETSSS